MTKKIICVIIAIIMVVGLVFAACDKTPATEDETTLEATTVLEETTVKDAETEISVEDTTTDETIPTNATTTLDVIPFETSAEDVAEAIG